jgi:nicotinamide mononucleotide transporter
VLTALCSWLEAHGSSCPELLGAVTGVAYVVLAIRQRPLAWPVGLISVAAYTVVYARGGYYSESGLQIYYALTSIYGWYHWSHGGARPGAELPVTRAPTRTLLVGVVVTAGAWLVLALVTSRIPGASVPYADAFPAAVSLLAQWLTTRKYLESWAAWLVANAFTIGLYLYRGVFPLSVVLFAIYFILAIRGHVEWKRSMNGPSHA